MDLMQIRRGLLAQMGSGNMQFDTFTAETAMSTMSELFNALQNHIGANKTEWFAFVDDPDGTYIKSGGNKCVMAISGHSDTSKRIRRNDANYSYFRDMGYSASGVCNVPVGTMFHIYIYPVFHELA